MRRTIAIVLIAIMALTVVSSAGVVTAASWGGDHGKKVDDRIKIRDRDDRKIRDKDDRRIHKDPCIIKVFVKGHFEFNKFHHKVWVKPHWEFINICKAHDERLERIW